jgi:hypothetical protein
VEDGYEEIEVVHVIKPFRLVDSESYERVYWRRDGVALAPGYYVVRWSHAATVHRFDEDTSFSGPYMQRSAAYAAAERLRARS